MLTTESNHLLSMLLKDYLKKYNIRPAIFGYELGLSHATIYNYLKGTRTPTKAIAERIVEKTANEVTMQDLGYESDYKRKIPIIRTRHESSLHKKGKKAS